MSDNYCEACGHTMDIHFKSAGGRTVCLHSEEAFRRADGYSMGMVRCDCIDFRSERAERAAKEKAMVDEAVKEMVQIVREL